MTRSPREPGAAPPARIRVLTPRTPAGGELTDRLRRLARKRFEVAHLPTLDSLLDGIHPIPTNSDAADLMVFDLEMAAESRTFFRSLRWVSERSEIPIVVISRRPSLALSIRALECGATDFLAVDEMSSSAIERSLAIAMTRAAAEKNRKPHHQRALSAPTPIEGVGPPPFPAAQAGEASASDGPKAVELAIEGADAALWSWHLQSGGLSVSSRWLDLLELDESALSGGDDSPQLLGRDWHRTDPRSWFDRIHPEDRESFRKGLQEHLRGESTRFVAEHRIRRSAGSGYRWVRCQARALPNDQSPAPFLAGSLVDITDQKAEQHRLAQAALHDPLTELPNRALFLDRVGQALARGSRRSNYRFAVLFLDLDRFKTINDSLGHAVGDQLLLSVGQRLRDLLRPSDWVARIGGDEFAILADDLSEPSDAPRVAQRVLQKLALPHAIDGREVYTTASIGVTLSGPLYTQPDEMLRDADNAMYRAKGQGRARYQLFDPQMHESALQQLALENDLRRALRDEELELHYQPIVKLSSGEIEGFEALLRWRHPERGLLGPDEFIGIAEETGSIHQIGRWVLDGACRQAAHWQRMFPRHKPLSMNVNISGREFLKNDLIDRVQSSLDSSGLAPGTLRLELTETSLMEQPEIARQRIEQLRNHSVRLHLDDFGTGYCSLSYLQKLPTDTLKIDRSFISQVHEAGLAGHIIETIVSLAHRLGIGVSAEGLETQAQVETLRRLSCNHGQGFYFSEAVLPDQAETLLSVGRLTGPN